MGHRLGPNLAPADLEMRIAQTRGRHLIGIPQALVPGTRVGASAVYEDRFDRAALK